MLRRTALSVLLLLSADAATTALSPDGTLTAEAAAADFTGRIKTIRIKKTRAGSSFKVVAQTSSSKGAEITGGTATLTDPATGEEVETVTLGAPFHGTVVGTAATSASDLGDEITVGLQIEEAGYIRNPRIRFDISSGRGDGASADGWKAKATLTPQGTLRVVVMSEDRTWDGGTLTDLTVTTASGASLPLDVEGAGSSLQASFTTDLDTYSTLTATVSVTDAEGQTVETVEQDFEFEGTAEEVTPLSAAVLSKADGAFSLTTWTADDGTDVSLEVEVSDAETGEAVLLTTDDTPLLTHRSFTAWGLEFDDTPDGYSYLLLVDLLDEGGKVVASQQEVTLTVPKFDGEAVGTSYALFDDKSGAVGLLQGSDGIWAHVVYEGEEAVASAVITFEEPFEGPTPLESELSLTEAHRFHRWVQAADADLPASWELTVSVVTAEGEPIETQTATGSGEGTAYQIGPTGSLTHDDDVTVQLLLGADGQSAMPEEYGEHGKYGDILIDGVPLQFD